MSGTRALTAGSWSGFDPRAAACLFLLGCAMVGALVLGSEKLYLAAVGGSIVAGVILLNPRIGFYLTVAAVPLETAGRLGAILPFVNITVAKLLALATFGSWLMHLAGRRARFEWNEIFNILILYFLIAAMSLITAREFERGYQELSNLATTIVFFIMTVNMLRTPKQVRVAMGILAAASALTFAFAIAARYLPMFSFSERGGWHDQADVTFGVEKATLDTGGRETIERSSGTTAHSILLAVNTVVILPLLVAFAANTRDIFRRMLPLAGVGLALGACVVSFSRTGMVGFVAAAALLLGTRMVRVTPARVLACAGLGAAAIFALPDAFLERVLSPASYTTSKSESLRQRIDLVTAGLEAFINNPLNGIGLGSNYGIFDYLSYGDTSTIMTVHNAYVQVSFEIGFFGISTLLFLLYQIGARLRRAARGFAAAGDRHSAVLARCMWISLAVFLVCGFMMDFMRMGYKNMWLIMASGVAMERMARSWPGERR